MRPAFFPGGLAPGAHIASSEVRLGTHQRYGPGVVPVHLRGRMYHLRVVRFPSRMPGRYPAFPPPMGKNVFARFTAVGSIFSRSRMCCLAWGKGQTRR
jgi:hypothetical protein